MTRRKQNARIRFRRDLENVRSQNCAEATAIPRETLRRQTFFLYRLCYYIRRTMYYIYWAYTRTIVRIISFEVHAGNIILYYIIYYNNINVCDMGTIVQLYYVFMYIMFSARCRERLGELWSLCRC